MPTKIGGSDKFANFAAQSLMETVADTTAYGLFNFPYSMLDKMGIIINRIEYTPLSINQLNTSTDYVAYGLAVTNNLASIIDPADPAIVDMNRLMRLDLGAAASGVLVGMPSIKDFADLPGGGILCAPNPLYLYVGSSGAAGVVGVAARVFFTIKQLAADEYWELVESRRVITA